MMQKFLFVHEGVRGVHVRMPRAIEDIMRQHHYPDTLYRSLGSCLVASVLLANRIKFTGDLTMQLEVSGAISLLVAKCNDQLSVRGLARWDETADSQQLAADFDHGRLVISVTSSDSIQRFQSIVEIKGNSLSQALEHYFLQSEQLPTLVQIDVDSGAGLILQSMPDQKLDANCWAEMKTKMADFKSNALSNQTDLLLNQHFGEHDIQLFQGRAVEFKCHCSSAKMLAAVKALGEAEVESLLSEHHVIEVTCEYCNHTYGFGPDEARGVFSE